MACYCFIKGSAVPSYARPTTSSMMSNSKDHIPDNYDDDAETQILSNINSEIFLPFVDKDSSQASKPRPVSAVGVAQWEVVSSVGYTWSDPALVT